MTPTEELASLRAQAPLIKILADEWHKILHGDGRDEGIYYTTPVLRDALSRLSGNYRAAHLAQSDAPGAGKEGA